MQLQYLLHRKENTMRPSSSLMVLTLAMTIFIGCKEAEVLEGTLTLNAKAMWEDQALIIGETYADPFDRPINVEQFRAYISNIYAIAEDGSEVRIKSIDQINFAESWEIDRTLPAGSYKGIRFGIGVPEAFNMDHDPAEYPNDHVLGFNGTEGMFWSWASGYIFVKFEGKTALDGDATNLLDPYAFHVGNDMFYTEITLNKAFEIGEARTSLDVVFHCEQFLQGSDDTIDLSQDYITHTMDNMPLADRFIVLFRNAVSIR